MSNFGTAVERNQTFKKIAGRWPAMLFLVLLVSAVHCQTAPASPPKSLETIPGIQSTPEASQFPNLKTNANEVTLDLVVRDKNRKPILDLKPEDIVITDNDVPVKLNGLRLVTGNANSDHLVTLVFDHFYGPTAKNAQTIAIKVLKMLPAKGYSFALLDFAGRLRLIQGFTDDRSAITQAVKIITEKAAADKTQFVQLTHTDLHVNRVEQADPEVTMAVDQAEKYLVAVTRTGIDPAGNHVDIKARAHYQTLLTALESSRQIRQDQHTLPTLAGLLALVRSQQKVAERKSLIYFTQNMQMDSAAKEMVKTVTGEASRAGVSVYVVDLDALNMAGRSQMENALLNGQKPYNPGPIATSAYTSVMPLRQLGGEGVQGAPSLQGRDWGPAQDIAQMTDFMRNGWEGNDPLGEHKSPLAELAKNTGGAYVDAQDNVKRPLQQMLQDMTTYYEASYIPPIQEYDGSFRTISAKPVRAGLNIKTKTGYFAVAPGADGGIRPFEVPLLKLLSQPQLPADLKFHASVIQFGELPDGNTSAVAVEVPIAELETKKDTHTDLFSAHVSIVAVVKDEKGIVIEHFAEDVANRGAAESIDKDKSAAIVLQRHFMTIPGKYVLEAAVYDQFGSKAGAQRINFEIPAVQSSLSMSDLVLVRKIDTFHEEDDPAEPMRYEKGKITPNLSRDVPPNAKSVSLFFILHPDPKSTELPTLQMIASRNGRAGKRMPLPLSLDTAGATAPYLASFKSGLPPGDYGVKAMLSQDGKTAVQELSFTVEGDQEAAVSGTLANAGPQGHGDAAAAADSMSAGEGKDSPSTGLLAITSITNPIPPPSPDETRQLIADARERALHYIDSLPNFMCVEVTNRSVDAAGSGKWKLRDTITELLRYRDKAETRTMLQVNGKANDIDRQAMKGTFSSGELGGVLKAVFIEFAKADFTWKETDRLGSGTLQVFNYRVAQGNSVFSVVGKNDKQVMVAFHGQVFIDIGTRNVRRITLVADDLPRDFPTHYTSIAVDYDYVSINAHDYLMPVSAELRLRQGRHEVILNAIEFRNYRRFGSNMRILGGFTPVGKP